MISLELILFSLLFNFQNYFMSLSYYFSKKKTKHSKLLLNKCTLLDISATLALLGAAERDSDYLASGSTIARYLRYTDRRQGTFGKRFYGIVLENAAATSISAENSFAFEK